MHTAHRHMLWEGPIACMQWIAICIWEGPIACMQCSIITYAVGDQSLYLGYHSLIHDNLMLKILGGSRVLWHTKTDIRGHAWHYLYCSHDFAIAHLPLSSAACYMWCMFSGTLLLFI